MAIDSLTVVNWVGNTIDARNRVKTKCAAEMLVKRHLGVIRDTITEFGLRVSVSFVSTAENKADCMSNLPKAWLMHREMCQSDAEVTTALSTEESVEDAIWAAHLTHQLGVDRMLYIAKQIRSDLSRKQVKLELAGCPACQRVNPALRSKNFVAKGSLSVKGNWHRVGIDITHNEGRLFLSMVDCGPSRFEIWHWLQTESADNIIAQLHSVITEQSPCYKLLMDNSMAFRSAALEKFGNEWRITLKFCAAYAPGGNEIVERNHRTIKRIAEKGEIPPPPFSPKRRHF